MNERTSERSTPAGGDTEGCQHPTLMPRWRGPEVMGDDARAMGFVCHQCHREFPAYLVRNRKLKHVMV